MSGTVSRNFQAVVTVKDQTGGPLAAIQARLAAIAGVQGMDGLRNAAQGVQRAMSGLASTMRSIALPGALVGAAALTGLIAMTTATVEAGGRLQDLSDRLGMSVENIQAFEFAARQSGVSAEIFTASIEKLQKGIAEAAGGQNANLLQLFTRLRIPLRDAQRQIRSTADVLPQLAQAFERNTNPAVRTRMAMALFGEAGARLIPMLASGRVGLAQLMARFRELNPVLTTQAVAALDDVGDSFAEVRVAVEGVRDSIVVSLAPILGPLLRNLATWIAANRELIAARVSGWLNDIVEALKAVDWAAFVQGVIDAVKGIGDFVKAIGGLQTVLIAFAVVALAPVAASLVALGGALASTAGLVVAAAAIVVGGFAYVIYTFWGPIQEFLIGLGEAFMEAFRGVARAFAWLQGEIGRYLASEHYQHMADTFGAIFTGVANAITWAWSGLATFVGARIDSLVADLRKAWEIVRPIYEGFMALTRLLNANTPGTPQDPATQQRRQNYRGSGARVIDPDNPSDLAYPAPGGSRAAVPRQSSLITAGQLTGSVGVTVRFENAPSGTRVDTSSGGVLVAAPEVDVGYSRLGAPN